MDLKSFMQQKGTREDNRTKEIPQNQRAMAEDMMAQAKQYEGMGEDKLMGELMKNISQGREDGSFSEEKLNDFITKVSPMLNPEQRRKLEEISGKLR